MKTTPAFPQPAPKIRGYDLANRPVYEDSVSGMTLRQYYAAKLIAPMVFSSNNSTSLEQDVAKAMENFNIPLIHCDYIANLIRGTLLATDTENSQMLKDVSSVKLDLADEGYLLSTKKNDYRKRNEWYRI